MRKVHMTFGCKHYQEGGVPQAYTSKLSKMTCKTCLKDLLQVGGISAAYRKRVAKRLLTVRYLNREPAVMRLAALVASGKV